jgi:hypothetical protein
LAIKPRYSGQFGNLVGLRCKTPTPKTKTRTRVIRITEETWKKLRDFSCKYHDQPITHDEIFCELVDFYNNEQNKKFFLT